MWIRRPTKGLLKAHCQEEARTCLYPGAMPTSDAQASRWESVLQKRKRRHPNRMVHTKQGMGDGDMRAVAMGSAGAH